MIATHAPSRAGRPTDTARARPLVGVSPFGLVHDDIENPSVDERFRRAADAKVFAYVERSPPPGEVDLYLAAAEKYALPVLVGGYRYVAGRDEALFDWHIRLCQEFRSRIVNVQLMAHDAHGSKLSDEQILAFHMRAAERADRLGVRLCCEIHVDTWTEDFGRVRRIADLVRSRGTEFKLTLDPSHVIFKVDNPRELNTLGVGSSFTRKDAAGLISAWLNDGLVGHVHARGAAPNNPPNDPQAVSRLAARTIQYPFCRPESGTWRDRWRNSDLDFWRNILLQLLAHDRKAANAAPLLITAEYLPQPDYGKGGGYSIIESNVACAKWLMAEVEQIY